MSPLTRDPTPPGVGQYGEQAENREKAKKEELRQKKQELRRLKTERRVEKGHAERIEYKKRKKSIQQEIFQLERELRAAKEQRAEEAIPDDQPTPWAACGEESRTGALPDFAIVGAKKGGTTFLYNLLTRHPLVEPAAKKELHYFDVLFDEEGVEWYRRCFPPARRKDGRRTITGEATPYLDHRLAPERMAEVVPQARLIVLLRNPVDRAYSDYRQMVRKGREARTFEQAVEEAMKPKKRRQLRLGKGGGAPGHHEEGRSAGLDEVTRRKYLKRGIYVDHLLRWSRYFHDERMLVLKSEDLFERPRDTLKPVLNFLDLPDWEPGALEFSRRSKNEGEYERKMDPTTRRRLEKFFEPHNRRLYEYLGVVDFGW